ncbi:MAG TPA: gliding motility-associated ABC transporter substrate-binding protein GldG [Prolixibacteraceae bacterium]|jgi:ABC-2 type transport system permease protein|nr:gliding motility-associated ABC transporter substrate-binding protein GldG [Prolixibacteraceae bacterium]
MFSLLKKEITSFFGSLTGYIVVFVFLLATSLFLWVFPGNYNILDGGYASLDALFTLAPWVYLFLVPAVTMRLFAEEKRLGTMEVLLTRPLSVFRIVLAKYLAGLLLVTISLLPTLVYFYSAYALGNPVGCIDTGGTWGAYIGLFFLAAIYVAIGLLASALTDNQIFSFILAMGLSFLAYMGFDMVGSLQFPSAIQQAITGFGINEHYMSISRGVVDSRDLVYFLSAIFLFIFLTSRIIHFHKINFRREVKLGASVLAMVVLLVIFGGQLFFRLDLTAEKRYSITTVSKNLVKDLNKPINITLYLAGELPSGFRKLQKSVQEKIADYNAYSSKLINLTVIDPYQITNVKQRDKLFGELTVKGLQPTDIRQNKEQGTVTTRIFPGAIIQYGEKQLSINLLKNNQGLPAEVNLNNSIEGLEYEFTAAFTDLLTSEKQTVSFLNGQGELNEYETHDFAHALADKYIVTQVSAQQLISNGPKIKTLMVANPTIAFTEKDKFCIDQYLMNGGRIIWLIDPVSVSLDSLSTGLTTLAFPQKLNLDDQLFKYGIRLNANLVQDAECLRIPVNTAPAGQPAKFAPAPWYFSPLLIPSENHVISRNLNRLKAEFVSSIDTVGGQPQVGKTVILATSPYSLVSNTPMEVSLASINNPPDRRLFSQPSQSVGVLLEGTFTSVFKNRMVDAFGVKASQVKTESQPTRMIIFSDGNLIANKYRFSAGNPEYMPLGYDQYSQQTFGNRDFLLNAVNYLCDDQGLMELRSRVFKIRLLDKVRIREEKTFWQMLNVLMPLVLIALFGGIYVYVRRRKYSC